MRGTTDQSRNDQRLRKLLASGENSETHRPTDSGIDSTNL